MTIYQFTLLDEAKQAAILHKSILIGTCFRNGFAYECRQVDYFYVECRMVPQTQTYLSLRTFTNPDLLQPYWDLMDPLVL